MIRFFFVFLFFSVSAYGKNCTLDEIRHLDTQKMGQRYSVYPVMTKATLMAPLLAYVPRMDAAGAENTSFSTVSFVGLAGWFYFGLQSFSFVSCDDEDSASRRRYNPSHEELLRFHRQQRTVFWKNYYWMSLWMVGLFSTTYYTERKVGAVAALAVPWSFALSRRWTAFSEDLDLQYVFYPDIIKPGQPDQTATMNAAFSFRF